MSATPPRRSDTRSSLRDVRNNIRGARKALHDDFTNLKRRMSSNIGSRAHSSGHSSGPGPGKRAKMMVSKTVEKVLGRASSTSPRSFEPRVNAHEQRPSCTDYHPPYPTSSQLQQQQDPSNAQLSVLDSQIHAGQSSYPTDPIDYYETNNTIQQYNVQQQQQLGDSMFSTPMLLDSAPIASHPVSAFATHNITVPYINTNVEAYPPNDWNEHATTTSRAHILGSPSITPPPHHAYVEGPIHDLNQLDRSATLRGIHEDRYKRTVSTVNDLSAAVISRGSPTNGQVASLPASPETASPVSAKGKGPASPPGRNGSTASTGDSKNPCPWPGCDGTRDTNLFESNRLKEHLRRKHLWPYMCDSCEMRKGDKHQIKRHRENKHPNEDPKQYKDQTNDGLAAKQLKMLSERAISYERIVKICQAKSVEELDEPRGSDGRTYQGLAVRQETNSVPVSPTSLLPRTSIYGAGLGAELGVRAGAGAGPSAPPSAPPSITFADSIPSGYPSAAGLLPAARIPGYCGPRVDTSDQFMEFVNNVLVPHVENLNFSASSSPTRASCKEHLRRVLDSIAASAEKELDKRERRRSSGAVSNTPSYGFPSYTDMVTSGAQISAPATAGGTPALTNDKSLTTRSSSYGSLNPPPLGGYTPLYMRPNNNDSNQKPFEQQWPMQPVPQQQQQQQPQQQQQQPTPSQMQQPDANTFGGNDGLDTEQWMNYSYLTCMLCTVPEEGFADVQC